jgi:hypothetical protein
MAQKPVMYGVNLLESAILTLEPDGTVAGKDVDRLTDRDIGLECEDADAAGDRILHADLGIDVEDLDAASVCLLIGSGIEGESFVVESSEDDTVWDARGTVVGAADGVAALLTLTGAPVTTQPRYWRWTVTDPSVPIRVTELFLSPAGVSLTYKPSFRDYPDTIVPNVLHAASLSGRTWGVKQGDRRVVTPRLFTFAPDADRATVLAFGDAIEDGAKPFWLQTVEGALQWTRLPFALNFRAVDTTIDRFDIPLPFEQELA